MKKGFNYDLIIAYFVSMIFFYLIVLMNNFNAINWGDNGAYLRISQCIKVLLNTREISCQIENKYSVGYPALLASISYFVSNNLLLLALPNIFIGLINTFLVSILFGRIPAFYSIFLNISLMQRNYLGGSDPLFLMFTLASFLSVKNIYYTGALNVLSFATRVIGIINIFSATIYILLKRKFSNFIWYALFLLIIFSITIHITSIVNDAAYTMIHEAYNRDRYDSSYINYPFLSFILAFEENSKISTFVKFLSYFLLFLSTFYYIIRNLLIKNIVNYDIYYLFYGIFLLTYNSSWAYIEFVRFYAPIMPISLFYLTEYLPNKLFMMYFLLILFSSVSALSVTGFFLRFQ